MVESRVTVYVGLGANLGDPIQNIIDAQAGLANTRGLSEIRRSSLYWSSPLGYADQSAFINCVIEMKAQIGHRSLFSRMQEIEQSLGRVRTSAQQNGPRSIDIDLLLYATHRIEEEDLLVPHPRIWERRFVLEPLLELAPELEILGDSVDARYHRDLLAGKFAGQEIYRLGQ